MFQSNHLIGFGAFTVSGVAATITHVANTVGATGSTVTFTGAAIGSAASGRRVIVGVASAVLGGVFTLNSVTIGGNNAAQVITANETGGGVTSVTELWILQVDAGTTANIILTFSTSVSSAITVWAAYDLNSSTATDTGTSTANPMTDTLNIDAGGVAAGMLTNYGASTTTHAWTNLTETADAVIGGDARYGSASAAFAAAQSALAITATPTGTTTANAMVIASFR